MDLTPMLGKNRPLRNLYAGRRCFILGNGPSLNEQNVLILKDEVTIALNSFHRHPQLTEIAPKYWLVADPRYWECPQETLYPLIKALNDHGVTTKLFAPSGAFPVMNQINYGAAIDAHFFHYDFGSNRLLDLDFTQGIPPFGQNVVIPALMLALYMGCNPIYLIGCDHGWWNWTRESYASEKHERFYVAPTNTIQVALSFDELQRTIQVQREQYAAVQAYARRTGHAILNATREGHLDVFPRVDYESLFPPEAPELRPTGSQIALDLAQDAMRLMEDRAYASALVLLERAMELNVHRHVRVSGIDTLHALCLAMLGQAHHARLATQRALALEPASEVMAQLLTELAEARPISMEARAVTPRIVVPEGADPTRDTLVAVLIRRGEQRFGQGELQEALEAFVQALELDPTNLLVLNNLGVLHWQSGSPVQAMARFQQALAIDPGFRDALLNLTDALSALGRAQEALPHCRAYLERAPDDTEILSLVSGMKA